MRRMIAGRAMFRVVPLIAALGVVAGCNGEDAPQTAEFPKMEKQALPSNAPAKPAKGMDRTGSELAPQ